MKPGGECLPVLFWFIAFGATAAPTLDTTCRVGTAHRARRDMRLDQIAITMQARWAVPTLQRATIAWFA